MKQISTIPGNICFIIKLKIILHRSILLGDNIGNSLIDSFSRDISQVQRNFMCFSL